MRPTGRGGAAVVVDATLWLLSTLVVVVLVLVVAVPCFLDSEKIADEDFAKLQEQNSAFFQRS